MCLFINVITRHQSYQCRGTLLLVGLSCLWREDLGREAGSKPFIIPPTKALCSNGDRPLPFGLPLKQFLHPQTPPQKKRRSRAPGSEVCSESELSHTFCLGKVQWVLVNGPTQPLTIHTPYVRRIKRACPPFFIAYW